MFYLFYIGLRSHFEEVKTLTKKHMLYITSDNFKMTEEGEHQIEFICDWFRLTIYDNAKGIQFTSEDYCLELKVLFWFDVYYSEDGTSGKKMMEFIGLLLKSSSGDSILLSNGDIPILQRKGETIVVDDSKLELIGHFPFECLNIRYEKGRLVQI